MDGLFVLILFLILVAAIECSPKREKTPSEVYYDCITNYKIKDKKLCEKILEKSKEVRKTNDNP